MSGHGTPGDEAAQDDVRARKRRVAARYATAALCLVGGITLATFRPFSAPPLGPAALDQELRRAIAGCDADEVRALIALGADPNRVEPPDPNAMAIYPTSGSVPLQAQSRCPTPETLQALVDGGAVLGPHLRRLADLAMLPPRPEVMDWLLDHGLDPNLQWRNLEGWETLLHRAVRMGSVDLVRVILQHGANPEALDSEGLTPMERLELLIAQEVRDRAVDPSRYPERIDMPAPEERFAPIIALLQEAVRSE